MWATVVTILHVWIGAAWLGGVWFSLANLHRRGPGLFTEDAEAERVLAGLSRGNRWLLVGTASAMAISGVALGLLVDSDAAGWSALIIAKGLLLVGNVLVFGYVSWIIWPRRLFALPTELPAIRRRQTMLRIGSLLLLGISAALGIIAHAMRSSG